MIFLWLLCGLLFGPGPAVMAPIDGSLVFSQDGPHESLGEPVSQINYLNSYIHSITDAPQDSESSTNEYNPQDVVDMESHASESSGSPEADGYSTSVDQHNKLPQDFANVLQESPAASREHETGNAESLGPDSVHGMVIVPGDAAPARDLTMPPDQPTLPVCEGAECGYDGGLDDSGYFDPEDYEDIEITDDLASTIADVLLLSLNRTSTLSIRLKVYRPSAFFRSKDASDGVPRRLVEVDIGEEVEEDGGDDEVYYEDDGDSEDLGEDDHLDEGEYSEDEQEDKPESDESEMAVLRSGQTGILLDDSQTEGVLLMTEESPKPDSTQSLPQDLPLSRKKRALDHHAENGTRFETDWQRPGQIHDWFRGHGVRHSNDSRRENSTWFSDHRYRANTPGKMPMFNRNHFFLTIDDAPYSNSSGRDGRRRGHFGRFSEHSVSEDLSVNATQANSTSGSNSVNHTDSAERLKRSISGVFNFTSHGDESGRESNTRKKRFSNSSFNPSLPVDHSHGNLHEDFYHSHDDKPGRRHRKHHRRGPRRHCSCPRERDELHHRMSVRMHIPIHDGDAVKPKNGKPFDVNNTTNHVLNVR